jgi:hypothetical protein
MVTIIELRGEKMKNDAEKSFLKLKTALILCAFIFLSFAPITNSLEIRTTSINKTNQVENTGFAFQVTFDGFQTSSIDVGEEEYKRLIMDSCGFTADYGKVELPAFSYNIAVPQGAEYELNFEVNDPIIFTDYNIYPAQPPKPDSGGFVDPPFTKDEVFYSKDEFYPESIVEVTSDAIIRGCRIIRISIYPLLYNPVKRMLKQYNEIDVNVEFIGGTNEFIPERLRSPYFQPIFDSFLINSGQIERAELNNPTGYRTTGSDDRADLLIVVYDDFYEEILPLAEWRHTTGIETKVVKWSDIGEESDDLVTYVEDAYNNWELPPSFLLIVGDADHVPVNYLYNHPYNYQKTGTDHWYVTFDGDDYLPELHTGRISVENEDELIAVVNKILDYSKTPYMDVNWFDDVLLAACEEYGRFFVYTSERIFDFLDPLGYSCNRQYYSGTPPGSTAGVIEAINNGVIIANHRDHGASQNDGYDYTGWSKPSFTNEDILDHIDNGRMYPVMFSLNCDSGWFDGETDLEGGGNFESIGEIGIRVEDGGFSAVIAATRVSYSGYNDEFCCGLYDAMWSDFDPNYPNEESANPYNTEVYRISQVMNYGKFWMYDKYIVPGGCSPYPWNPTESNSRVEFEMFHVHGDPTMDVWTAMPQNLNVSHEILIDSINVVVECERQAVEGALVCICEEDGVYARGITDDSGRITINVDDKPENEVALTVTCHNYLFYQETVYWNQPPSQPEIPNGNSKPDLAQMTDFTTYSSDPEDSNIFYKFDWGDGQQSGWLGPYESGETVTGSHSWSERGFYDVKVCAKDEEDMESTWSESLEILVGNTKPKQPKIQGKWLFVKPDIEYEYTFTLNDADSDQVWLKIRWSIDEPTEWIGPFESGDSYTANHTWDVGDAELTLAAKSKDVFEEESDWKTIKIYTSRDYKANFGIFERLISNFPILNFLLKSLLY